jgi:hypothetical protein
MKDKIRKTATKSWTLDRYARGAYDHFTVGQLTSFQPFLKTPVGRPHFAGEHTAEKFRAWKERWNRQKEWLRKSLRHENTNEKLTTWKKSIKQSIERLSLFYEVKRLFTCSGFLDQVKLHKKG